MAGYLEQYGVADARRNKVIRRIVISGAVVAVCAVVLFYTLRTYPAKRHVHAFLADLARHDYKTAYRDWGCAQGCPDYTMNQFMEDWGPKSTFANASAAHISSAEFCNAGVIVTVAPPAGRAVPLWYDRNNGSLGFSPWDYCYKHIPEPSGTQASP
jgi:hypothetical protein